MSHDRAQWRRKISEWSSAVANHHRGRSTNRIELRCHQSRECLSAVKCLDIDDYSCEFVNVSAQLKLFTSLRNLSFTANCFHRTEVKCYHNHSEHNNRNCPVSGKITPAEVAGSSWGSVCVPVGMSTAPAPAAEVGVAPVPLAAVARVFQLQSHREPPQTTVRECCECHKRTMSFSTLT